jgi:hypothetical protein
MSSQLGIAFHHAQYATRCMVCGAAITKGSLIATPVSIEEWQLPRKSKGRWCHPPCLKNGLPRHIEEQRQLKVRGWRRRQRKRQLKEPK